MVLYCQATQLCCLWCIYNSRKRDYYNPLHLMLNLKKEKALISNSKLLVQKAKYFASKYRSIKASYIFGGSQKCCHNACGGSTGKWATSTTVALLLPGHMWSCQYNAVGKVGTQGHLAADYYCCA